MRKNRSESVATRRCAGEGGCNQVLSWDPDLRSVYRPMSSVRGGLVGHAPDCPRETVAHERRLANAAMWRSVDEQTDVIRETRAALET